jgi:AraC-like DNA-binding protein
VYADSLGLAIVSRLLAREFGSIDRAATRRRASLPAWRVKRAIDYIDAHLSEQLSLSDIAQSAGLSRMHFAAQFRAATGMRPHEFLLRRRVERAQTLLMRPRLTSLDVALSTGFRSQAHFTTVFKRLVGETPARWRADARGNS